VNNQKNKKYIANEGEMDLKVPNHEPAHRNVTVLASLGRNAERRLHEDHLRHRAGIDGSF